MPAAPPCIAHLDTVRFKYPLPHLVEALKRRRKTRIVAIGSSSTAGESQDGKIVPYPGRLEVFLRNSFHGRMIDVLNRGIGGQEAGDELARFEPDVIGEAPSLVIWQVGTNAVYRFGQYSFDDVKVWIETGLEWLRRLETDVILMDLQYTTAVVKPCRIDASERMVALISDAADKAGVNVFRRFALMRRWCEQDHIPIANLIDPDDTENLHMSEWSTDCVTRALHGAIEDAMTMAVYRDNR